MGGRASTIETTGANEKWDGGRSIITGADVFVSDGEVIPDGESASPGAAIDWSSRIGIITNANSKGSVRGM